MTWGAWTAMAVFGRFKSAVRSRKAKSKRRGLKDFFWKGPWGGWTALIYKGNALAPQAWWHVSLEWTKSWRFFLEGTLRLERCGLQWQCFVISSRQVDYANTGTSKVKKSVQKIFEMTLRGVDCSELTCLWMAARSVGPRRAHKAMTWPRLHKHKDRLSRNTSIYLYKYK